MATCAPGIYLHKSISPVQLEPCLILEFQNALKPWEMLSGFGRNIIRAALSQDRIVLIARENTVSIKHSCCWCVIMSWDHHCLCHDSERHDISHKHLELHKKHISSILLVSQGWCKCCGGLVVLKRTEIGPTACGCLRLSCGLWWISFLFWECDVRQNAGNCSLYFKTDGCKL